MFGKRKKLGLALGSGGAKGAAHLGVIKVLEESGLSFEVVAGTSIGSIVGAMLARGYSSTDTMELVRRLDYKNLAVSMLLGGGIQPVKKLLSDSLGCDDFADLKIPFAAVATDVSDASEVVLKSGNLPDALLASSAMPPFFKGVEIDGRLLADGAFVNAVPGNVAKALGADFVIGVALSEYSADKETRFMTAGGEVKTLTQTGFAACDVLLTPPLGGYAPTDVLRADELYDIGYEYARDKSEELLTFLKVAKVKTR